MEELDLPLIGDIARRLVERLVALNPGPAAECLLANRLGHAITEQKNAPAGGEPAGADTARGWDCDAAGERAEGEI